MRREGGGGWGEEAYQTLPVVGILIAELSEEDQLSLAVKASIDTIQKDRRPKLLVLFTNPQVLYSFSFSMFSIQYLNLVILVLIFS